MRIRNELNNPKQFLDMYMSDLVKDPLAAMEQIYKHFDRPYDRQVLSDRIDRWFKEQDPQAKYGAHSYTLEQFGLCAEEIESAFARYIEAFFPSRPAQH